MSHGVFSKRLGLTFLCVPVVTWTRDNTVLSSGASVVVKVEGERHTLLIRWAKQSDAGTYCATAVNEVGRATSSASLSVKTGEHVYWGNISFLRMLFLLGSAT